MMHSATSSKQNFIKYARAFILAWILCTGYSHAALETSESEELRNRAKQEALERERQLKLPSVKLQGVIERPETLRLPPFETPCFKIQNFVLEVPSQVSPEAQRYGASTLPLDRFRFAQDFLEQYAGQCIGREGINIIVKGLTAIILEQGYSTTRLGILEQDLSGGTLKLTLIPGLIHELRFEDKATTGTWKNAFPTSAGKLLNLRDIEQGLEQMKRIPSQEVDMQIVPADKLGESDIVINVKRSKPWKVTATLDDAGAKGTGKLQAGLNLAIDNLFNINDLFNIGVSSDGDNKYDQRGTQGNNIYYSIPYGNWTHSLSANESQYHQRVVGTFQTFLSSGKSSGIEFKTAYMFHRDQSGKSSVQFRTGRRWGQSFIDDTEILVQRRETSFAEIALQHKRNIAQAQLDVTIAERQGMPWFGAQKDLSDKPAGSPTFLYSLEILDATLSIPFELGKQPIKYTATFHGQNSDSALYGSEWIAIGNRWTVRGFDGEYSLAAENGWYFRNEFETFLPGTSHAAYIALDAGRVFGANEPNLIGNDLSGTAIGMRGYMFKGFYYDAFVSWPLNKPQGFNTSEPATGFSLNYQL
ncbi:MAG TPA: ShlB/FhaC/HecB family hemolysin secretion/activation protein [Gallionellaceae bacterium]|nr:ShlB/FhaC/HecB family hemolysin secretion/activation protein [Gallionellaceae bacterium]